MLLLKGKYELGRGLSDAVSRFKLIVAESWADDKCSCLVGVLLLLF